MKICVYFSDHGRVACDEESSEEPQDDTLDRGVFTKLGHVEWVVEK